MIMSEIGNKKLADAIPHKASEPAAETRSGKAVPGHTTTAEQTREAQGAKEAADAEGSIRVKMVDIGRGNQQAGRQGQ
jgi:hypothetical protein